MVAYVLEGQKWTQAPTLPITWSFAEFNYVDPGVSTDRYIFTSFINDPTYQAVIRQAFQNWTSATGLQFKEIPDTVNVPPDSFKPETNAANIRIGFADLQNYNAFGIAGLTSSGDHFLNDLQIGIEQPGGSPNGLSLNYGGDNRPLLEVTEHEIGHALGLGHTDPAVDPNSIMIPAFGNLNYSIDATDIAGIKALYFTQPAPPKNPDPPPPKQDPPDPTPPAPPKDPTPPAPPKDPTPPKQDPPDPTPPKQDPPTPPKQDPPPPNGDPMALPHFYIDDQTTGEHLLAYRTAYVGPVSYLDEELIIPDQFARITHDNLNITGIKNVFIKSGSGDDAIDLRSSGGNNIVDGSTGSNYLTGGSGHDEFYIDDRNASADIWSTIANAHSGDDITIWGLTANDFAITWKDNEGAVTGKGLTLHATKDGAPTASVTLVGYTTSDLSNGRLSGNFGTSPDTPGLPGSLYMNIHLS